MIEDDVVPPNDLVPGDPTKQFSGPLTGAPASQDPARRNNGKFAPGHSGNPLGKRKGKNFATTLKEAFQRDAGNAARELAAGRCHVDVADIPEEVRTFEELMAWVAGMLAIQGQSDFWKEYGDRIAPKPRRVEVSGPGGGPVRQQITQSDNADEANAAEDYYGQLDGDPDQL